MKMKNCRFLVVRMLSGRALPIPSMWSATNIGARPAIRFTVWLLADRPN